MAVRRVSILAGRDRMRAVLVRFLGHELALERANNIAQALVFRADDPASVARGMLREMGLTDVGAVADEVGAAWMNAVVEAEGSIALLERRCD